MKEYIEREAVVQDIIKAQESLESNTDKGWTKNKPCFKGLAWANRIILETPAADVTPIVHGEWLKGGGLHYCSNCGNGALHKCIGSYSPEIYENLTPYCPECGAIMDGGNK